MAFWILCDDTYNLQQHFLTHNISECVEINVHSLLLIIINLKQESLRRSFDEDIAHHPIHELPSEDEIEITVLQAQQDAEKELALLGIAIKS